MRLGKDSTILMAKNLEMEKIIQNKECLRNANNKECPKETRSLDVLRCPELDLRERVQLWKSEGKNGWWLVTVQHHCL